MHLTPYHEVYLAYELTQRCASDSDEKLTAVLSEAQVDLNPHQVDAALFAFRSPLSRGVILADEVGLGKTIEAGLLIAQKWAERKRRLLVIAPANLRKQWQQELADKFFLPSVLLETATFSSQIQAGNLNPFCQEAVVICSYQFARKMAPYVRQTKWDLVVIDEAHRLRNVYKPTSKIANSIKNTIASFPKVLLTATPLQNSRLELYGLVSVIDEFVFPNLASFKLRFSRLDDTDDEELKARLRPICKRTLRRQVLEYVPFTNRHALLHEFTPLDDEQKLYDDVSEYLRRPKLYALPKAQRPLIRLVLWKLLASSTYAIAGTLCGLADKLSAAMSKNRTVDAPPEELVNNWEGFNELADEYEEDVISSQDKGNQQQFAADELKDARQEIALLHDLHTRATAIVKNAKGEALLVALRQGLETATEKQTVKNKKLQPKALIFTESRRTQNYLFRRLQETEFAGRVMIFNGTNDDEDSKGIFKRWLAKHRGTDRDSGSASANMRAALIEHFREVATIMIATEAAAEGVNLQFCNLVVNYDLPWNPQRVEQRIGRCHRYGQKFDVVVVNLVNKTNAADQRVYELLASKFKLFDGVFGASDEVLGAIVGEINFEEEIAVIYETCRTPKQIQETFVQLQQKLEATIAAGQCKAYESLLNNFDRDVVEKVRIASSKSLPRFNDRLWTLTRHSLSQFADFDDANRSFHLFRSPYADPAIRTGLYRMGKHVEDANNYRVGHPLAQQIIRQARNRVLDVANVVFEYTASGSQDKGLKALVGHSGWLRCAALRVTSAEATDFLVVVGITDQQESLDDTICRRFFDMPGSVGDSVPIPEDVHDSLSEAIDRSDNEIRGKIAFKNQMWLESEMIKLNGWAKDRKAELAGELPSNLGEKMAEMIPSMSFDRSDTRKICESLANGCDFETACRKAGVSVDTGKNRMSEMYARGCTHRELSKELDSDDAEPDEAREDFNRDSISIFAALAGKPDDEREDCKKIDCQKDLRIEEIRQRFELKVDCDNLFTIRWILR